jgi:hypothetical protein
MSLFFFRVHIYKKKTTSQVDEKQILFCTLYPFPTSDTTVGEELQNVSINFRLRECRASSTTRVFPIVFTFESCDNVEWTGLHNLKYCSMSVVLNRLEEPCGIRIYLNTQSILDLSQRGMTSPQFMALESVLASCLTKEFQYSDFTEKNVKRKKLAADAEHIIEVPGCTTIATGLYWDYEHKSFSDMPSSTHKFKLNPTFLVSNVIPGWQDIVLQCSSKRKIELQHHASTVIMPSCNLIITKQVDEWANSCKRLDIKYMRLDSAGIIPSDEIRVVIADEESIAASISNELNFVDLIDFSSTFVMGERSDTQLRRIIIDFSRKLKNFKVPVGLLTFGSIIIEDDCFQVKNLIPEKNASKWIYVYKDNTRAVPKGLSSDQIKTFCPNFPRFRLDNYITIVPVHKSILRKIKIFGKSIKNGIIESRIASHFQKTFCPVPFADALERFSGRAMTLDFAKELIKNHFECSELTLADFSNVNVAPSAVSQNFVQESLERPKTCSICFDDLLGLYGITLCGHIYCTECILRHFQPAWTRLESKECAHCRTNLLSGDLFHIDTTMTSYEKSLPCKKLAIKEFVSMCKSPVCVWPEMTSKNIIVEDISTCSLKDLIYKLQNSKHAVNIHMFYMPDESSTFKEFQLQFL